MGSYSQTNIIQMNDKHKMEDNIILLEGAQRPLTDLMLLTMFYFAM